MRNGSSARGDCLNSGGLGSFTGSEQLRKYQTVSKWSSSKHQVIVAIKFSVLNIVQFLWVFP